ncbi:Adenosine deaminase [Sulfurospirillum diekertiae]|uniref:adenosine deaminase n=1 Tax=Sulfurospirillum diekertiae TaxID=1854492 RepID=A0A290HSZ0_9BACT|nr:adenosine deaminase [Sulfurospirillum diekertiae]ATB70828.1 Adenosine deaminase [Sulfurospirillum diekertiae]
MRYLKHLSLLLFLSFLVGCAPTPNLPHSDDESATSALYERSFETHVPNVAMLNLFFTQMPKGGDLHHHYTGSIYAETYLEWVKNKGWFIDSCSFKILKAKGNEPCKSVSVDELIANDTLYRKLLTIWSDKDFDNHSHEQLPPDSNFFNTFGYFSPISDQYMDVGLNIIKERALSENVSYIETMLSRVGVNSAEFFNADEAKNINAALRHATTQEEVNALLDRISAVYAQNQAFSEKVHHFVSEVEHRHEGIDTENFTMRFQTYAVRVLEPLQVYTDLLAGYKAVLSSPLIVGVNIVAPENNTVAINDYTLHMRMFNYLASHYPQVPHSLHAGELTIGMVEPKELLFHITQARKIAGADRIGHGVDIAYEKESLSLLKELKEHAAIEINLSSNEFILGVAGREHPYSLYAAYGVPIVISTDDSGVSRDNLAHEYVLLASRYHPSYATIKTYVYNSIDYSFLTPAEKAKVKMQLDKKFEVFEKEISTLAKNLK